MDEYCLIFTDKLESKGNRSFSCFWDLRGRNRPCIHILVDPIPWFPISQSYHDLLLISLYCFIHPCCEDLPFFIHSAFCETINLQNYVVWTGLHLYSLHFSDPDSLIWHSSASTGGVSCTRQLLTDFIIEWVYLMCSCQRHTAQTLPTVLNLLCLVNICKKNSFEAHLQLSNPTFTILLYKKMKFQKS